MIHNIITKYLIFIYILVILDNFIDIFGLHGSHKYGRIVLVNLFIR